MCICNCSLQLAVGSWQLPPHTFTKPTEKENEESRMWRYCEIDSLVYVPHITNYLKPIHEKSPNHLWFCVWDWVMHTEYNTVCTYTRWPFACIYLPKYGGAKHTEKDENGDKAMQCKEKEWKSVNTKLRYPKVSVAAVQTA